MSHPFVRFLLLSSGIYMCCEYDIYLFLGEHEVFLLNSFHFRSLLLLDSFYLVGGRLSKKKRENFLHATETYPGYATKKKGYFLLCHRVSTFNIFVLFPSACHKSESAVKWAMKRRFCSSSSSYSSLQPSLPLSLLSLS